MKRSIRPLFLLFFVFTAVPAIAQTGKIAGRVTEAGSGDPLPGVNVVIDATTQGTSSDADGYFTIINIRPGTYDVRASFVGFTPVLLENVQVNIDLTTEVNFELQEEVVGLDELVVTSEQEVVKRDLSASRVDITADQIQNLPVTDINRVVGLQAGVQGLNIRGSGADQAAFILDGFNLGTRRDNTPYTNISYAGVDQIQIQSGGFTAKYGDMRSGVVNVVTKEGFTDRYTLNLTANYSPATDKYFGVSPSDPASYWMRPYTDPDVAFVGTENGSWDEETQNQYPFFQGYNSLADNLASDENPGNDLTPEQIQALFLWQHRRDLSNVSPDYVIDGGFGGPVPGVSQSLGDLRFFATYRRAEDQYIIPLTADGREQSNFNIKLTSNIAPGMKFVLDGMWADEFGTSTRDPRTEAAIEDKSSSGTWRVSVGGACPK
jgi:outer membrane receptor protein involved in Fe transport